MARMMRIAAVLALSWACVACEPANTATVAPPGEDAKVAAAPRGDAPEKDAPARTDPVRAPEPSPYDAQVKEFGAVTDRYGFERKYVQVAVGLSETQLIELAQRLHAREPETWFWMLDDDAQAAQMMEALPRTAQGDMSGYPREWVEQHTVAHVVMELVPGGDRRWVLARGTGSEVMTVLD